LRSPTKSHKQSPQLYGIGCATSSNNASRKDITCKRRIRWTEELHESFWDGDLKNPAEEELEHNHLKTVARRRKNNILMIKNGKMILMSF
jgi:hypothetical protein